MSVYKFPRPRKGLTLILCNSNDDTTDDFDELKQTFESLLITVFDVDDFEKELQDGESKSNEQLDIYAKLAKCDFSDYNVLFLIVLSDYQKGFEVFKRTRKSQKLISFDISKFAQSLAENETLLGYPKILIFNSSSTDLKNAKDLLKNLKLEGAITNVILNECHYDAAFTNSFEDIGYPGRSLANEDLEGTSKFFWDIFIGYVILCNGINSSSLFLEHLCEKLMDSNGKKHFEKIFFEAIESSQPDRCEVLSNLTKMLSLTEGKNRFYIICFQFNYFNYNILNYFNVRVHYLKLHTI